MSKVIVTAGADNNVINVSENPEYGYIRLMQENIKVTRGGWLRIEKRTALLHGTMVDLLKLKFQPNQELTGKIIVKESFTPFNEKHPDRNLKIAGKTGVVLRVNDQPIYRQTFYTMDENETDELIQHDTDCRNEIKEVMASQKALEELSIFSDDVDL